MQPRADSAHRRNPIGRELTGEHLSGPHGERIGAGGAEDPIPQAVRYAGPVLATHGHQVWARYGRWLLRFRSRLSRRRGSETTF
jgi:hypothetical protein